MTSTPKEGAGRPLYSRAPISPAQGPGTVPPRTLPAPKPAWRPGRGYLPAAAAMYLLAYFYTRYLLFSDAETCRWSIPVFAVLYLAWGTLFARAQKRPAAPESHFWAVCWLAQSLAFAVYGLRAAADLQMLQLLAWHATAVYWTMARTGMLSAGRSGIWTPLDLLMGVTALPWRDFLLRIRTVFHGIAAGLRRAGGAGRKKILGGVFSVAAAVAVCLIAWGQLAGVDATFAALADRALGWLDLSRLDIDTVIYLILSLPVGAWLFGLAGGGLRRTSPPIPAARLQGVLAAAPRLPASAGYLVPGALCAVYTLFFALQAGEFAAALGQGTLTAQAASDFAVTGFWELCRILLLDFAVMAALELFGGPLRTPGRRRLLLTVFGGFSLAFALLAAAKLGAYILLYGPTPLRMLSGWFLLVLLAWCMLALVWLYRPIPAARIGVLALAGSFAVFCCLPVERICVDENLRRYTSGQIETVDAGLFRQCAGSQGSMQAYAARRLLDAGWFTGRTADEISRLFYIQFDGYRDVQLRDRIGRIYLSDLPGPVTWLELDFQGSVCTGAELRSQ